MASDWQLSEGYVTRTILDDGEVIYYGMFKTIEEAQHWADQLLNATIETIYTPTYSRG